MRFDKVRGEAAVVQREDELQFERPCPGIQVTSERAERLIYTVTLSCEPLLVWRLESP
jgi:hypothetical protein